MNSQIIRSSPTHGIQTHEYVDLTEKKSLNYSLKRTNIFYFTTLAKELN